MLREISVAIVLAASAGAGAMTAPAAPAAAATGTMPARAIPARAAVKVRAIDREGRRVAVTAWLQSPAGAHRRVFVTLTSAHATRVPKGTYNVAALVNEPGGKARTLVDRGVTISGPATLTFDARRGRKLRFIVDDPSVTVSELAAGPFSPGTGNYAVTDFGGVGGGVSAGTLYLVPGRLPRGIHLYLQAVLTRPNVSVGPDEYAIIRVLRGSIPANPTFASHDAALANDHVTVRRANTGAHTSISFQPGVPGLPLWATLSAEAYGAAPFSTDFRFSPGYAWRPCASWGGSDCAAGILNNVPVFGAHRYWQTFGSAVFSPSPQGGIGIDGTQMQGGVADPFVDPHFTADSSGLYVRSAQAWLYSGGKLLQHTHTGLVDVQIPYATRWYRLRVVAKRGTRAVLSTSAAVSYTFPAAAQPNGGSQNPDWFWPRIIPTGLNRQNAARRGSATTVSIWFANVESRVAVHHVAVWASGNDGKSWKRLHVARHGSRYSVAVRDPATAGYVSLRVKASDPTGVTTDVTVIRAYAVS